MSVLRTDAEIVTRISYLYAQRNQLWETDPTNFMLNVIQGEIVSLKWILGEHVYLRPEQIVDIAQY